MAETFSVAIWLTNTMLALMLFSIPAFMIAEEVSTYKYVYVCLNT